MASTDDFPIDDRQDDEIANPNALFSPDSAENMPTKEDRVFRKAKRLLKVDEVSEEVVNGQPETTAAVTHGTRTTRGGGPLPFSKNSRKSRNPHHARAQNRKGKGGGGGKGIWGKPGMELDETGECCDIHDPNYDSDSQETYKLEKVNPELSDAQLDSTVKPILQEYLEHGNTGEVEALLSELNIGSNRHKIPKMAVMLAMDRHNPQRELMSQLISDLYSEVLTRNDIARGFDELLSAIDDLRLDTPDAHTLIGQFIARCVADDCLPPKFINSYKGKVTNEYVQIALEKAEVLLSMNHGIAHLDNIWGIGGGNRPVKYLSNKIDDLLKEYVDSGDKDEAMRCLQELDVPHFHHELVYQACDLSIEDSTERVMNLIVDLLEFLTKTNVITIDQLDKGMTRIYNDINDISLDVPAAFTLIEQLVGKLQAAHVITDKMIANLPSRGRKRFVSEGDGGKLKNITN
jgi:programmed cell death protein 4